MLLYKFESMLKTNEVYFFDATEFQHIIEHYFQIGKHSLVRKALQMGLDQHPTSIALKLLKVELYVFEDKLQEAVEILNAVEAIEPYNDEVLIHKASILSKEAKHIEAIEKLKEASQYAEDVTDVCSLLGMEYLYIDDYENARLNFEQCIDIDFEDFSSLYNIIYCFEMEEAYENAIRFLERYLDRNPYCEVAWHQLGRQYFTLNYFEKALKAFDYSIVIDELFIGGYLEKAKTLEQLNRYEEAIENYLVTLELDDPTAYTYLRIAECYRHLNQLELATQYYEKAVDEDPLLEKAWLLLTDTFYQQGDYQQSLYYIKKALQIDGDNLVYWQKCAEVYGQLNLYKQAVQALYKCIEQGATTINIYVSLADALFFLDNYTEAINVLIHAKKLYPDFAEIEYRLFGLLIKTHQKEHGLKHLKNGLAIDFDSHQLIKDLYPELFNTAEIKNIIADYQKAIS